MTRRRTFLLLSAITLVIGRYDAAFLTAADQTTAFGQPSADHAGRLDIIVVDPSGALVLSATVEIRSEQDRWRRLEPGVDRWTADALEPGSYSVRVTATGFEPQTIESVPVRGGTTERRVRLALETLQTTILVERDRQTVALDPRGFSTYLSQEQIASLPDNPAELERVLREMAPPGAVLHIDGFTGGMLPAKSQILSIRIPRMDSLAAQDHGGLNGFMAIDVTTRPGGGDVHANVGLTAGGATLNARSPLAASKPPAHMLVSDAAIDGPVRRDRVSFAVSLRGSDQASTATVRAALPGNDAFVHEITQPTVGLAFTGRLTATLGGDQVVRGSFSHEQRRSRNAGIGEYNLEERGYTVSSLERLLRLSVGGPWGERRNVESRLQLRWVGTRNASLLEAPTLQVLDAFTAGGAQATSGEREFGLLASSDLDYARGGHAWRLGTLLDADMHTANRRSNYLGTYVFPSLAAFESGRPAVFTRRLGDARVRYPDVQLGAYIQDDYRVSRSVLASYGLRAEWQNLLSNAPALLPRAGVTWSPRRQGTTTLRAGWGVVEEWLPSAVYEQARLVNGDRQHDLRIVDPAFPMSSGAGEIAPPESVRLADRTALPRGHALSLGVEQQLLPSMRLFVSSAIRDGRGLLRGRNVNPFVGGHRLDETRGNVIEAVGDARLHVRTLTLQSLFSLPRRQLDASASYMLNRSRTNTAGAFWLPPIDDDPGREWGPLTATHAATGSVTGRVYRLRLTVSSYWRTGMPYTITLAEPTEDGFFTARPAGVTRNASRTAAQAALGIRLSYAIGFGAVQPCSPGDVACSFSSALGSGLGINYPERHRFRIELQGSARNLTNRANYLALGNVVGSPLFGRPVSAGAPRTVDLGLRFWF